jgi:hypothetical protein
MCAKNIALVRKNLGKSAGTSFHYSSAPRLWFLNAYYFHLFSFLVVVVVVVVVVFKNGPKYEQEREKRKQKYVLLRLQLCDDRGL